jgi:eukaryotic-like serine/threonine-protein kinase
MDDELGDGDFLTDGADRCLTSSPGDRWAGLWENEGVSEWQRLGGYQVLGRVARGSTADIFLAIAASGDDVSAARARERVGVGRRVALKRLYPHLASDEGFVRMFLDEARLMARLRHRHIARVLDLDEDDETYFAVLELVDGPSAAAALRVRARRRGLPTCGLPREAAVAIAAAVADALVVVHALTDDDTGAPLGLVHRDVTPHNVLVARDGAVKLVDFGIAHSMVGRHRGVLTTKETTAGGRRGRTSYVAPELVRASPDRVDALDGRADLYALGATLWCLLCGAPPFVADNDVALLEAIARQPAPRLRDVAVGDDDEVLEALLAALLAKDPTDRPRSAADVAASLRAWLRARDVDAAAVVADTVGALSLPSLATAM